MNKLIDAAVRCSICGKKEDPVACRCWTRCRCGWSYPQGAELAMPQPCRNPIHREPPRDVACPYCHAEIGQACVQRNGIRQAWPHAKRQIASEGARR